MRHLNFYKNNIVVDTLTTKVFIRTKRQANSTVCAAKPGTQTQGAFKTVLCQGICPTFPIADINAIMGRCEATTNPTAIMKPVCWFDVHYTREFLFEYSLPPPSWNLLFGIWLL